MPTVSTALEPFYSWNERFDARSASLALF